MFESGVLKNELAQLLAFIIRSKLQSEGAILLTPAGSTP
jgi:hypothetical protein